MAQASHPPSLNGASPAPPSRSGGAFVARQPRTVFPREQLLPATATLLYGLVRGHVGGVRLVRWPQWLLIVVGGVWGLLGLPGGWWLATAWLLLLACLQFMLWRLHRHDFVDFRPTSLPHVTAQPLVAAAKVPIFVTGLVGVENKHARFTWLPAFYRTFPTREHALLCQVADRPAMNLGQWAAGEPGLWYAFFTPAQIERLAWGVLRFGHNQRPALAVSYRHPATERPKRFAPATPLETVYLTVQDEEAGHTILADLLYDWPAHESAQPAAPTHRLSTPPQDT